GELPRRHRPREASRRRSPKGPRRRPERRTGSAAPRARARSPRRGHPRVRGEERGRRDAAPQRDALRVGELMSSGEALSCAALSLSLDEPLAGTAPENARVTLLVPHRGAMAREPLESEGLAIPRETLEAALRETPGS